MAKKKKDTVEFRFYEIPQGESCLVLCGETWIRTYGKEGLQLHFHNLMELGICRFGCGELSLDGEMVRYENDCVTMFPENFPHITVSEGTDTNFWEYIFLDPKEIVAELFPDNPVYQSEIIEQLMKKPIVTSREQDSALARMIDAIIRETVDQKPFATRMIHLQVQALVMELIRRDKNMPIEEASLPKGSNMSQVAAALDYINKNYDQPIRSEQLAEICSMSETHFRRIFEEYINMTPMDYVNLIRIRKACELMKKSNDPMDVVAMKCGFTTTSTFNRNFKKFLDTSPYQWKINPGNYEHKLLNFRISALKGW